MRRKCFQCTVCDYSGKAYDAPQPRRHEMLDSHQFQDFHFYRIYITVRTQGVWGTLLNTSGAEGGSKYCQRCICSNCAVTIRLKNKGKPPKVSVKQLRRAERNDKYPFLNDAATDN